MVDWTDANCSKIGIDPEFFFPVGKLTRRESSLIREICGSCIIRDACYKLGKETDSIGIWGGFFFRESRRVS